MVLPMVSLLSRFRSDEWGSHCFTPDCSRGVAENCVYCDQCHRDETHGLRGRFGCLLYTLLPVSVLVGEGLPPPIRDAFYAFYEPYSAEEVRSTLCPVAPLAVYERP